MLIKTRLIEGKRVVSGSEAAGDVQGCLFGEHNLIDDIMDALEFKIDKMLILIEFETDDFIMKKKSA